MYPVPGFVEKPDRRRWDGVSEGPSLSDAGEWSATSRADSANDHGPELPRAWRTWKGASSAPYCAFWPLWPHSWRLLVRLRGPGWIRSKGALLSWSTPQSSCPGQGGTERAWDRKSASVSESNCCSARHEILLRAHPCYAYAPPPC